MTKSKTLKNLFVSVESFYEEFDPQELEKKQFRISFAKIVTLQIPQTLRDY